MIDAAAFINQAMMEISHTRCNYANDPFKFSALTSGHIRLHILYLQMAQAIASSEDNIFTTATTVLENNIQTLNDVENSLKSIVEDRDTVASIVLNIRTVAKFIAKLGD